MGVLVQFGALRRKKISIKMILDRLITGPLIYFIVVSQIRSGFFCPDGPSLIS